MSELYDPSALCNVAAKIMALLTKGTATKLAMECAGFKDIKAEYNIYRKRIERLRDKLKSEHPESISIGVGSIELMSTLTSSTGELTRGEEEVSHCLLPFKIETTANTSFVSCYSR